MSIRAKELQLENVTVSFDGFKALNSLSFHVAPGELLCIFGPNGAGKSTMMDVITGNTRPSSGLVRFGDKNLLQLNEAQIVAEGIGRKFQNPILYEDFTVKQMLELSLAGNRSFLEALRARITPTERDRMEEVLTTIGLENHRFALAGKLVPSQRQWLEIGMLLMSEPALLLVDEAVGGMEIPEIERTAELLLSLAGKHSVVVVEHDMNFVRSIARRVIVLHEGSVLAEGSMDEVQANPRVVEVYLGESLCCQ